MQYDKSKEFYIKIKNEYNQDYADFFNYFENTWLSLNDNNKSRYEFSLWSYADKIDIKKSRSQLISEKNLQDYVFLSNNACESLNHLINSLIAVNNNVSLTRFEIILKTLFIRMELRNNQNNQNLEHIERKQQLSDLLLYLVKNGYGTNKGLVTKKDLKELKNYSSESEIFKLIFEHNYY